MSYRRSSEGRLEFISCANGHFYGVVLVDRA